ncbi:MAG: hypothetical protein JO149_05300 [Gammaproteobacteria bacterium]|nr:hypothetical protein [Gammaproteobacteria bacterium]
MSYFMLRGLSLFLSGLIFLMPSLNAHAQNVADTSVPSAATVPATAPGTSTAAPVVIEKPVIVTAVPAPKETIVTPAGYVNCFTIKAGWYQEIWVAEHRVCQYQNAPSGVAWIEGYWTCTKYNVAEGQCTNWDWKVAHWEKTLTIY